MRWPQDAIVAIDHFAQRVDVGAHVAIGRRHNRGAPTHHVVAGEQRVLLVEGKAHVIRRVARGEHRAHGPVASARNDAAVDCANIGDKGNVDGLLHLDVGLGLGGVSLGGVVLVIIIVVSIDSD